MNYHVQGHLLRFLTGRTLRVININIGTWWLQCHLKMVRLSCFLLTRTVDSQSFLWRKLGCSLRRLWALFSLTKILLRAFSHLDGKILSRFVTPPVSFHFFFFFNNNYLPASFTWVTPKAASRTWNIADSAALPPEY